MLETSLSEVVSLSRVDYRHTVISLVQGGGQHHPVVASSFHHHQGSLRSDISGFRNGSQALLEQGVTCRSLSEAYWTSGRAARSARSDRSGRRISMGEAPGSSGAGSRNINTDEELVLARACYELSRC